MSGFVDTNVLIRHLTSGPPAMSKRATAFLREASKLYLTDLVVAETIYVLESVLRSAARADRDHDPITARLRLDLRSGSRCTPARGRGV